MHKMMASDKTFGVILVDKPLVSKPRIDIRPLYPDSVMSGIGWVVLDDFATYAEARMAAKYAKQELNQ